MNLMVSIIINNFNYAEVPFVLLSKVPLLRRIRI